jgi:hypothetical protein
MSINNEIINDENETLRAYTVAYRPVPFTAVVAR